MQYLLLIYNNEAGMAAAPKEAAIQMSAAYGAYTEAMKKAGVFVAGERLRFTSTATSVRVAGGKTNVIDGPYADTKEQLGGYYMIEVPDMDAAISWAARCPGAGTGTMEVRPVWPMAEYMTEYAA
ncbi:YciI family protein [Mesorhizobium sp. PAMC28654]|uniref:YciI family protein n=1 Tax=Mesorhizobium sp. PAMC28654 TaxID=2880934 RepID=UPI001D0A7E09|nr:YciI family protein [Mesorhizobium sp. PAMC28654]UDL87134.1 YciI family protein [Mesorhizobium sp. PAMC28654]